MQCYFFGGQAQLIFLLFERIWFLLTLYVYVMQIAIHFYSVYMNMQIGVKA